MNVLVLGGRVIGIELARELIRAFLNARFTGEPRHFVVHLFDERDPAVKALVARVIQAAKATGRKIGICGQAPSDYPEFAQFLVEQRIDSISLNPDAVMKTTLRVLETEAALGL
jgi:phosphoenolpyruvate synthase/pyruvate phosphate dikinase